MSDTAVCVAVTRPQMFTQLINSLFRQTDMDFDLITEFNVSPIGTAKNNLTTKALNAGYKYIQMVDDDDLVLPRFIEASKTALKADNSLGWSLVWGRTFEGNEGYIHAQQTTLEEELQWNHLHSWPMFTRETLLKQNYRVGLEFFDDWDLWIRILKDGIKGVIIEEELYRYRIHHNRLTTEHAPTYDEKRLEILKLNGFI